jgi:Protein of unknown function (DUF2380)
MITLLRYPLLATVLIVAAAGYCTEAALSAPQKAAVMEFELFDDMSAYEDPVVIQAENRRIALISEALRQDLGERGLYRVVDNRAAAELISDFKARQNLRDCNGCEIDIGKALGADVIVIGWVQKVSNLILNINVQIKDVHTGEMLYAQSVDLRSNTDQSWLRGIRYMVDSYAEDVQRPR